MLRGLSWQREVGLGKNGDRSVEAVGMAGPSILLTIMIVEGGEGLVVLEKTLESPLDCKEIQPVHSKGDQPWVFFGRNDAEAETPVFWPPHEKS